MQNNRSSILNVEELTWKEARERVLRVNPMITKIIDNIDPPKSHVLVKAVYPFGSEILKNTVLQLPSAQGELISYHDSRFDNRLRNFLSYNYGSNPVAICLKNTVELFFELEDRIIPFSIIGPGKIFGTWRILEGKVQYCPTAFFWGLTAGARSIFFLPKISEAGGYHRLKNQLGVTPDRAKGLIDHWQVFKEIVNVECSKNPWEVELIFFPHCWFQHKDDKVWEPFNYYLSRIAWEDSSYLRNQFIWDMIFSIIQKRLKIKSPAFFLNIIKQLLGIASGAVVGFQPAVNDACVPVSCLQDVFVNIYNLKHLAPIIMEPAYFDLGDPNARPVYYSLQYPTSLEFAPKANSKTSALEDLFYVRYYLLKYMNEILRGNLNIDMTALYKAACEMRCDFFHSNTGNYKEIRDSQAIFDEDPSFQKAMGKYRDKIFPKNSNFLNGCIRIAN